MQYRNPNSEWLFQPVYKNVSIPRSISYTTVKRVILKSLETSGVDDVGAYSSHSLRVGAAQELLRRGHSTSTIMRAGGWKSVNVLARYLEEAEVNLWG
jgi:integrase/recombinase XerD